MKGPVFLDTGVLVAYHDANAPDRQTRAAEWLAWLWEARSGRLSYQVLREFYHTVTEELVPGLNRTAARESVRSLVSWDPVRADERVFMIAWSVQDRHSLQWADATIVAAAKLSGSRYLLSEEFLPGQDFEGLLAVNPLGTAPDDLR